MSCVRLILAVAMLIGVGLPTGAASASTSVAERCPGYVAALQQARLSLIAGDRMTAIAALRGADTALAECIRRDADEAGGHVLLASSPASRAADYGLTD